MNLNMPSENSEGYLPLIVCTDMKLGPKLGGKGSLGLFLAGDIPGCVILPLSLSLWSSAPCALMAHISLRFSGQKGLWFTLLIRPPG